MKTFQFLLEITFMPEPLNGAGPGTAMPADPFMGARYISGPERVPRLVPQFVNGRFCRPNRAEELADQAAGPMADALPPDQRAEVRHLPGPLLWHYSCSCRKPGCGHAASWMGGGGPMENRAVEDWSEEDDDEMEDEPLSANPMPAINGFNRHLGVLNRTQTMHLHEVLSQTVNLNPRGNFPILTVRLYDLVLLIRERLRTQGAVVSYYSRFPDEIASETIEQVMATLRPQPRTGDNVGPRNGMFMDVANGSDYQPVEIVSYYYNGDYNDEDKYCEDYEVDDKAFAPRLDAPLRLDAIKLIGGAAAHVIGTRREPYNDVDFTFEISISGARDFDRIRMAVASAVLQMMPPETNRTRLTPAAINEAYAEKMLVVDNSCGGTGGDRWSLISLGVPTLANSFGVRETVELKFVDRMDRPYQFTVDSFQIKLDEMLGFYQPSDYDLDDSDRSNDCCVNSRRRYRDSRKSQSSRDRSRSNGIGSVGDKRMEIKSIKGPKSGAGNNGAGNRGAGISENRNNGNENKDKKKIGGRLIVYPAVVAESTFGDYRMAVSHLEGRWIITNSPEMIRGGGLLTYIRLLHRGYRVPPMTGPDDFDEDEYLDEYYDEDYAGRLRYNPLVENKWYDYDGNPLENGFFGNISVAASALPFERAALSRFYQDYESYGVDKLLTVVANYLLSHLCSEKDRLVQPGYLNILRKVVSRNRGHYQMERTLMLAAVDMMTIHVINGGWQSAYKVYKQFNWRPYRKRSLYELAGMPLWLQYQLHQCWCELRKWQKQHRPLGRHYYEHRYQRSTMGIDLIHLLRSLQYIFEVESDINVFLRFMRFDEEQLAHLHIMPRPI